jgi:hypothetical protein
MRIFGRFLNWSPTTDVDEGTLLGIWLGLPEHLMGDRGGVPLPRQDIAEQVQDRVALRPTEVAMRSFAGCIA